MSRTTRTYAAYVSPLCNTPGTEVLFSTASTKYDYVGLVCRNGQWEVEAKGWSYASVRSRVRTAARRVNPYAVEQISCTASTAEVTAPVVRDYFGSHRVNITSVFRPGSGWENVMLYAGRSDINRLAREGVTAVSFTQGQRTADFRMTELIRSMRARKAR